MGNLLLVSSLPSSPLGRRLAQARALGSVSRRRLSFLAGVSPRIVQMLESGHIQDPLTSTLQKVAGALGVSMDWLAGGEGEEPSEGVVVAALARAEKKSRAETPAAVEAA
jgi:transcriptional regulator with XRE-family HTH domain